MEDDSPSTLWDNGWAESCHSLNEFSWIFPEFLRLMFSNVQVCCCVWPHQRGNSVQSTRKMFKFAGVALLLVIGAFADFEEEENVIVLTKVRQMRLLKKTRVIHSLNKFHDKNCIEEKKLDQPLARNWFKDPPNPNKLSIKIPRSPSFSPPIGSSYADVAFPFQDVSIAKPVASSHVQSSETWGREMSDNSLGCRTTSMKSSMDTNSFWLSSTPRGADTARLICKSIRFL